jgi:Zn-dependent peptidase ImmA (M78 family)
LASIPKKVKLINYTWDILDVEQEQVDLALRATHPPGNGVGCCMKNDQTILISKKQSKQEKPRTVLHELLHACLIGPHGLTPDSEEKVVCLLEERLVDLIKNNPKLITYLKENL